MKKKAIIFDMGGVLVDLDLEDCKRAFVENLGFNEIHEILDPCHQKGVIGELEEGLISADEFRTYILERSNPGAQPHLVDESLWHILVGIEPAKVELLKKLSQNYDLYMLSNNNSICLPFAADIFEKAGIPLDDIFLKLFLSFEMKALKPSEEFYKRVVAQLGGVVDDMLFIDDSQKNVDGSIAAGLPAVYYKPGTDLSALLADVLDDDTLKVEGV
jgi:putative hydrolase of the HAD superfamily